MKRRIIGALLLGLSVLTLLSGFALTAEQRALSEKLVRLHVVASSDRAEDQALKLKVRDAVLAETSRLLEGAEEPVAALRAGLPAVEAAAEQALAAEGCREAVQVSLQRELFPTRAYESFSLPAGAYTALRVTLGEGRGRNWWCVVYPSLCLSASAGEFEEAAQAAGLSEGEVRLITGAGEGYVLKFKAMEVVERIREWVSEHG